MKFKRAIALRDTLLMTVRKMKLAELMAFRAMLASLDDVCVALIAEKEKQNAK